MKLKRLKLRFSKDFLGLSNHGNDIILVLFSYEIIYIYPFICNVMKIATIICNVEPAKSLILAEIVGEA